MLTLRLTQHSEEVDNRFRIEVTLEGLGARRTAVTTVTPSISEIDRNRIRWYLEDYLEHPAAPAPTIASGVEHRLAEIGHALFANIFEANRDTMRLWDAVCDRLSEVRIEISADIRQANTIPWELLRDPRNDACLALTVAEFTRVQSQVGRAPRLVEPESAGPVRVLLVICRPGGRLDVPFRSVANRLVKGLTETGDHNVTLDVLRPPTFEQLGRILRSAHFNGEPYHIVHFDGHGLFVDQDQLKLLQKQPDFSPNMLRVESSGQRGYVCFESADEPDQLDPIDGTTLGNLLYEAAVPVLVLNACRSAHGEVGPDTPPADEVVQIAPNQADQVRGYGSFAQAVSDAGVAGVVAMRYNIYVVTAAQFIGELYNALAEGQTLARAVTGARKNLNEYRVRNIAGRPIELQDWLVPIVHEAAPIQLFPKRASAGSLFDLGENWSMAMETGELPPLPDAGFFGRDETLLDLDRTFDRHSIVLLHGYAGSGKTATIGEFARWYARTGGIDGPVLFDSFERYKTLQTLIDKIGSVFSQVLTQNKIEWIALSPKEQRDLALQLLSAIPVLWIWDNIEPVAGFPAGTTSAWSPDEQRELSDFLRRLRTTRAKLLLTSRRDEAVWLGDIPARVRIPPMLTSDCRQLVQALVQSRGGRPKLVDALEPLIDFSRGNPLTLLIVAGHAIRNGVCSTEQSEALAARLRAGEAEFDDDVEQGRSKSLGASLTYGFENAFNENELKRLSLLYFFQGLVNIPVLATMIVEDSPESSQNHFEIAAQYWQELLERASGGGIINKLTPFIYAVHPAVPWFIKRLFDKYYPETSGTGTSSRDDTILSFCLATLHFSGFLSSKHDRARVFLSTEEANLLHARRLARDQKWFGLLVDLTNVIAGFYNRTGRRIERVRIERATVLELIDTTSLDALPGREDFRVAGLEMMLEVACEERNLRDAKRAYAALTERFNASMPESKLQHIDTLTDSEREIIRGQVEVTKLWIGILSEQGGKENLEAAIILGERFFDLAERIEATTSASGIAFHIGHADFDLKGAANVTIAEQWYQKALERVGQEDEGRRRMILFELAQIRYARAQHSLHTIAQKGEPPNENDFLELSNLFNSALNAARTLQSEVSADDILVKIRLHHLIGNLYDDAGSATGDKNLIEEAAKNYQSYIKLTSDIGDIADAATGCREMARLRLRTEELDLALIFAEEAVRKCESIVPTDPKGLELSKQLVTFIRDIQAHNAG